MTVPGSSPLFIALNINNVLPVYQLLLESSLNLGLKYVLPNNEDSDRFSTFSSIVLSINNRKQVFHPLYEFSYNMELKYVRANSVDSGLVRYMTVSNLIIRCLSIVLIY